MSSRTDSVLEFDQIRTILANYAVTEYGQQRLGSLSPTLEESKVLAALRDTSDARKVIDTVGNPPLTAMKELRPMLTIAEKGGMLLPEQLERIQQFISSCRRMKTYLKKAEAADVPLASWGASFDTLDFLWDEINCAIRNGMVDSGASKELRDLRRKLENLNLRIKTQLEELLRKRKEYFSDSFISNRDGHFTLPVKKEYKFQVPGLVVGSSSSGATYFIEPTSASKLRGEISALKAAESAEEDRILYALTSLVDDCRAPILQNIEAMEALDFIFAKGKLSAEMDAVCPRINLEQRFSIKQGRHPLLNRSSCVPLDFFLGDGVQGLVITGPNTGGKTVSLKTVGLFTLMAQSGLHLPCYEADIPLCSAVLCDIGDGQSISENLSTFSAHITNIIAILQGANAQSLVLLDELGSGTDPAEGMGLAVAILEELRKKRCLFVATTHYPEVKEYAERTPNLLNARMTFDRESLKPLYQLEIGEAGESCALYIARRLGLPRHMLQRAFEEAYRNRPANTTAPPDIGFLEGAAEGEFSQSAQSVLPKRNASKQSSHALKFHVGDSVIVYPKKELGIVCRTANEKGEIGVQIRREKRMVSHKRLQLKTPADQLYPEDYDFSIVFDSVENRKARHQMEKRHEPGLEIRLEEF